MNGAATTVDALAARLHGTLHQPDTPGYDRATRPRNATAQQAPAAVATVADADDVAQCIQFAQAAGMTLPVQSTGHGAAGRIGSTALLVDTSDLTSITIDTDRRVARVGAGVIWSDLNAATEAHGLLGPTGTAPDVDVAGYTFFGGIDWLVRPHGLASRRLLAVDYVDGKGERRRADATHDTPALGEGRWLTADTPRHALDIFTACGSRSDNPLLEIELRHVGNAADTAVNGALTTCPGAFLLHAVGAAPTVDAAGLIDDAVATLLAAAKPVDTGRSAASFRDGRITAPNALDDAARARLDAVIADLDPDGVVVRPRSLV